MDNSPCYLFIYDVAGHRRKDGMCTDEAKTDWRNNGKVGENRQRPLIW